MINQTEIYTGSNGIDLPEITTDVSDGRRGYSYTDSVCGLVSIALRHVSLNGDANVGQ